MQNCSSINPYVTSSRHAGVGSAPTCDIIDRRFLDPPECVRSGSNQQWSIIVSNDVQMDPCGDHSLEEIERGLNMKSAILRCPMHETVDVKLLAHCDRAILVPA